MTTTEVAPARITQLFPDAPAGGGDAPHSSAELRKARLAAWRANNAVWRWALWGLFAVGLVLGFLIPPVGIVMVIGVIIAWVVIYFIQATKASSEFFAAYGAARGLVVAEKSAAWVSANVPLLRKGDERKFDRALTGRLMDTTGSIGLYTYTEITRDSEGNTDRTDYDFTLVHLPLPPAVAARYLGVYCRQKTMSFGKLQDKLSHDRGVEIESAEFHKRYTLRCVDQQDDVALFELMSTTFIQQLVDAPKVDSRLVQWEQVGGDLLVYMKDHQEETADLDALVEGASIIYQRYCEEYQ